MPYYDRPSWWTPPLDTVSKVLLEGIVLVVIVLFLFLGDLRSSIIVIATLILTPALTFLVMNQYGMSANLMSLGGLAIAIGLMVDGSVVVVENVFAKLGTCAGAGQAARHLRSRDGSGHARDLRHRHHHPRLPAADDAGGHGRQDVRAAGLHHRDRARHLAGAFADAFAGAFVVPAEGRQRARHVASCAC